MQPKINMDYYPARWRGSRNGNKIVAIIAHSTVGVDSRKYLQRGGDLPDGSDKKVSIHVLIQKDGTIYRMVDDAEVANHAGYGMLGLNGKVYSRATIGLNLVTLGFELENWDNGKDPYPAAQLLSMGWQIAQWRAKFGHLPIYRHTEVDPPPRKYDTRALSVPEIELWVGRVTGSTGPAHGLYQVEGLPIYHDSQLTQPTGEYLPVGSLVQVDGTRADGTQYTPSAGHLLNGKGFVDLNGAKRTG